MDIHLQKYEMHFITHLGRNDELVQEPIEADLMPTFTPRTSRPTKEAKQTIHDLKLSRHNTTLVTESKDSCKCYIGKLVVEVLRVPVQQIRADSVFLAEIGNFKIWSGVQIITTLL